MSGLSSPPVEPAPSKKGGPNWALLIVGGAAILGFLGLLAVGFGEDPEETVFTERPAPDLELEDLAGKVHKLSDQDKPVVLNFWATWCVPCKAEHPVLLQNASLYPDVQFFGVLCGDNPAKAQAYLNSAGSNYPTLMDPSGATAAAYGVTGVPETFFIDADQVIRFRHNGPVNMNVMDHGLKAIR